MRKLIANVVDDTLDSLKQSGALGLAERPRYTIDPPKDAAHGDFSVNVAMVLAKAEGKKPRDIAAAIVTGLVDKDGVIAKVDVAGPGFLNFTVSDAAVQRVAREVLSAGAQFGRGTPTGKKVMVEYVSANPTGPIHIGHARGAFTGDAIARLLAAAGHDVTKEFYTNDWGNQIDVLARTVHKRYLQAHGVSGIELAEGEYPAQYVVDIAEELKRGDGDKWLQVPVGDPAAMERMASFAIEENLAAIKRTLHKAGIVHDMFFSEASLHRSGKVVAVVDHYKKRGVTYEAERARGTDDKKRRDDSKAAQFEDRQQGGTFLETSKHGDAEDRIILRKDGTPVYLTADLAYHKEKFDRGFARAVDVFGADHGGHVPRMKAGVALLGFENAQMDFVLVQMVRIVRAGEPVKMSKRKGTVYELDDLVDDIGADACRFIFLTKTTNAQFDIDLELVSKQASDNPVFYFQYGHARCASILKKAAERGQPFQRALTDAQLAVLTRPEERDILKRLSLFPDVVTGAAEALEPHRVLAYCGELIAGFHSYYTKYSKKPEDRVITADANTTQGRLALIAALKQVLANAFAMIGVDAPEHMAAPKGEEEGADEVVD